MDAVQAVDDHALGTSVRLVVTRPGGLRRAKTAVDTLLRAVDEACSRFREDSELSRLNAAPGRETEVSPLLATALAAALRAARLSGGAVDPTVGPAVRAAGYGVDFALVPADGGPIDLPAAPVPGWRLVRFDERRQTVCLPPGVELDLGATAKALAADLAAVAALDAAGGGGVLVSLGGDIAVGGETAPGGWRIQAGEDSREPVDPARETIRIVSGGVATSSTTVRRWRRGGVELHHLIDPATGRPTTGPWRTATVVAATCLDANIAATTAIVHGHGATSWLEALGLPARLVDDEGHVTRVAGWPEPARRNARDD
jgi:thiamine biosynthesis lipoprotein ApbE